MGSDGDTKENFATFIKDNSKFIKELDIIIENNRLFLFIETKKMLTEDFLKLFDKNTMRNYMMNSHGVTLKLKL
jgi:hypothetical protein